MLREECMADDVVAAVVRLYMRLLTMEPRDESLERCVRLLITTANPDVAAGDAGVAYDPAAGTGTAVRGHKGLHDAHPVTPRKLYLRNLVRTPVTRPPPAAVPIHTLLHAQLLEGLLQLPDGQDAGVRDRLLRYTNLGWLLLFIGGAVTQTSAMLATRLLATLLVHARSPQILSDFRAAHVCLR
jgi:hypothetical protein